MNVKEYLQKEHNGFSRLDFGLMGSDEPYYWHISHIEIAMQRYAEDYHQAKLKEL